MGDDPDAQLVLLRFSGDISIKARATRHQFVRRLLHNLRDAIVSQGLAPRIRLSRNRIFVELPEHADFDALARVFGIQSISRVVESGAATLDEIVRSGEEIFRERVRGKRFAVRARRVGDRTRIPLSARDVERALGAALLPASAGVDLDDPEVIARVELLEGEAYFFPERTPAHGGLPLGVEGRAVTLLSGGFDSAVAAWQLLRRGVALDYVFCNLGGDTHQLGVLRVAKVLADRWHYGDRPQLHAIDFEPVVVELRAKTAKRYWQILLKRLMLRAAEQVALERRAGGHRHRRGGGPGLVADAPEPLGDLRATEPLILRPLVGANKDEIIRGAEQIGTFELSKVVGEYCDLVARDPRPARHSRSSRPRSESRPALLERAVARRAIFDLRSLDVETLDIPELELNARFRTTPS